LLALIQGMSCLWPNKRVGSKLTPIPCSKLARALKTASYNFNRSFENESESAMPTTVPFLGRFLGVAAIITVISGWLLGYQQFHRAEPAVARLAAASPEIKQLVRDEHGLVANMLTEQLTGQKQELAGATPRRTISGR
jgi:hypothetical protein